MKSEEKQLQNLADNTTLQTNLPEYMESDKVEIHQLDKQLKEDDFMINNNRKDPRLVAFGVFSGATFLFIVALYFGIINP
jgi:hypothetical protein